MEDDARLFLIAIMQTVSLLILWLLVNIFIGLYLKYGLFENTPSLKNIVYYGAFLTGSFFLFKHIKKKWKNIKVNF